MPENVDRRQKSLEKPVSRLEFVATRKWFSRDGKRKKERKGRRETWEERERIEFEKEREDSKVRLRCWKRDDIEEACTKCKSAKFISDKISEEAEKFSIFYLEFEISILDGWRFRFRPFAKAETSKPQCAVCRMESSVTSLDERRMFFRFGGEWNFLRCSECWNFYCRRSQRTENFPYFSARETRTFRLSKQAENLKN